MSLAEVLAELPAMSVAERQQLIRTAVELDEAGLSRIEEQVVVARLEAHRANPSAAVGLDEMKRRLTERSRP